MNASDFDKRLDAAIKIYNAQNDSMFHANAKNEFKASIKQLLMDTVNYAANETLKEQPFTDGIEDVVSVQSQLNELLGDN